MEFLLNECDVEKVFLNHFKTRPSDIIPWFDTANINVNAVSSQNNTYGWRFSGDPSTGALNAGKQFPLYVGQLKVSVYNSDPIQPSLANSYVVVDKANLDSIGTFYNTTSQQIVRYGIGTFNGATFPGPGINEGKTLLNNPQFVLGPWMTAQVFTDGTGAVFLQVDVEFNGWRVYIS